MTIGEIIKTLVKTDNYLMERAKINDATIHMIKEMMPFDYELFQEKEEAYQYIINAIMDSQSV